MERVGLPSALSPPFAVVGTAVATSGTTDIAVL